MLHKIKVLAAYLASFMITSYLSYSGQVSKHVESSLGPVVARDATVVIGSRGEAKAAAILRTAARTGHRLAYSAAWPVRLASRLL